MSRHYYERAAWEFRVRPRSSSARIDYTLTIRKHENLPKSPVTVIMRRLLPQSPLVRMDKYCERQYGTLTRVRVNGDAHRCTSLYALAAVTASPDGRTDPGIADHPPDRLAGSSHRSPSGTVLFEGPRTRPAVNFDPDRPARRCTAATAAVVAVHLTADETTNATLNKCTVGVLILRTWRLHYGPREFSETRRWPAGV